MNILVIGSGGREHALIKSMKKSPLVQNMFVLPGNDGMDQDATLLSISVKDHAKILQICKDNKIELAFIGPEEPSVDGLSDFLRSHKIACVAPSQQAAQLEGSKIYAKDFMNRAKVPTARSFIVSSVEETMKRAEHFKAPYILKADGLAAGKGVYICKTKEDLQKAATETFVDKKFGKSGERALLEENLPGIELSFHILTNGEIFECLPLAQDHKRLADQNNGPNTGGMGTVAPLVIPSELQNQIIESIIRPTVQQMKKEDLLFRGILFVGLMVVDNKPYVLEYNTRFGDPETQVILPLIKNDTARLFYQLAHGKLEKVEFHNQFSFCIVNAAAGYPDHPKKGSEIKFDDLMLKENILFAGVKRNSNNQLETNGGRVLNVVTTANTYQEAQQLAYKINQYISFEGRQFRSDIGNYQFQ